MVSLRQWRFRFAPPEVRATLRSIFKGYPQAGVNENAHNVCKDHLRDLQGQCMSRPYRFTIPHAEEVLKQYDRPELQPKSTDRAGARNMPAQAFDALSGQPSIAEEKLGEIIGSLPKWPTYTPQSAIRTPVAMELLILAHSRGDWDKVGDAWVAIAFFTGPIVQRISPGEYFVVLDSCPFGVLLWPCQTGTVGAMTTLAPKSDRSADAAWARVLDLQEWQAIPIEVCSPLMLRATKSMQEVPDTIH